MGTEPPDRETERAARNRSLYDQFTVAIRPQLIAYAKRRGPYATAEDAVQEAFYVVWRQIARTEDSWITKNQRWSTVFGNDPGKPHIDNLTAYAYRVTENVVTRVGRSQGGHRWEPPDGFEENRGVSDPRGSEDPEDDALQTLSFEEFRNQFAAMQKRAQGALRDPHHPIYRHIRAGRTGVDSPEVYRNAIATVALSMLNAIAGVRDATSPMLTGDLNADLNQALTEEYPARFADPACSRNTRNQRLNRGRADVRAVWDELRAGKDHNCLDRGVDDLGDDDA